MSSVSQPAARAAQIVNQPRCTPISQLLLLAVVLLCTRTLHAQMQPIDLRAPSPQWQAVFDELGSHPRIEADFAERRFFAFRRSPRRLEGRMVYNSQKGFALDYTAPRYTVFVQPELGIHIVRGQGEPDEIPQGAASATALRVMPHLMRFAPQELAKDFSATGEINTDGTWALTLRPTLIASLPGMQEIRMEGAGGQLTKLVLVRAANERSEIDIRSARFPAADAPLSIDWPTEAAQ